MTRAKYDLSNPEKFIDSLRQKGLDDEDTLNWIREEITPTTDGLLYNCHSCGRIAGSLLSFEINGQEVYSSVEQIVYAYRDHKPYGLCSDCFEEKKFADFDKDEIEYFSESFSENHD